MKILRLLGIGTPIVALLALAGCGGADRASTPPSTPVSQEPATPEDVSGPGMIDPSRK